MSPSLRRAVLLALLAGVLGFAAWRAWRGPRAEEPRPTAPADTAAAGFRTVRLYFAAPGGDSLVTESRDVPEQPSLHARIAALVAELDRGPREGGVAVLPAGTSVTHVYLGDDGLLTLDLSRAFLQGPRGGTGAEYLAVASLVRTLAANERDVRQVILVCGGAPLTTLGGHLPLDRAIDPREMP
jgi:hypothetical protein